MRSMTIQEQRAYATLHNMLNGIENVQRKGIHPRLIRGGKKDTMPKGVMFKTQKKKIKRRELEEQVIQAEKAWMYA